MSTRPSRTVRVTTAKSLRWVKASSTGCLKAAHQGGAGTQVDEQVGGDIGAPAIHLRRRGGISEDGAHPRPGI